jgi:hypothetical protein
LDDNAVQQVALIAINLMGLRWTFCHPLQEGKVLFPDLMCEALPCFFLAQCSTIDPPAVHCTIAILDCLVFSRVLMDFAEKGYCWIFHAESSH